MLNDYYLGFPECIFATKLSKGTLTLPQAQELCSAKYTRGQFHSDKLVVTAPITAEELQETREQFSEPAKVLVPKGTLSLMVQGVYDNDTLGGATPSHQAETQAIDNEFCGSDKSSKDEITLPIPPAWKQAQEEMNMVMKTCWEWKEEQFVWAITRRREWLQQCEALHLQVWKCQEDCGM